MAVELTEEFLAKAAGWEAMKEARALVSGDRVLSSEWSPPNLRGVVMEGQSSYRAGLVIKGSFEIDNVCTCRQSKQRGLICAHSVAVGIHFVRARTGTSTKATMIPKISPFSGQTPASAPSPRAPSGDNGLGVGTPNGKKVRRVVLVDGTGVPDAELCIILPPLLINGAPRGVVMVYFEARTGNTQRPLDTLIKEGEWSFGSQDSRVLDEVESITGGATPGFMQISLNDFIRLLFAMTDHPRVTLGKRQIVSIQKQPWAPAVEAKLDSSGEIVIRRKESGSSIALFQSEVGAWVFSGTVLQPVASQRALGIGRDGTLRITRSEVPKFLMQDWPALSANPLTTGNFRLEDFRMTPVLPKFTLEMQGMLARLEAKLSCWYGSRMFDVGDSSGEAWIPDADDPKSYSTRDFALEQKALTRLRQSGFQGPDSKRVLVLNGETSVLKFFAREFELLKREWKVTLEEKLERATGCGIERVAPRFQVTASGEQWFDLHIAFSSDSGERLSPSDIQRLIRSGQHHTRLKNGKLAIIDSAAVEELNELLVDLSPEQLSGSYRINEKQSGFLDASLRQHDQWRLDAPAAWREKAGKLSGAVMMKPPELGALGEKLRPYQVQGVAWLKFLRDSGYGGILADEMGLGKTVQTLALLRIVATEIQSAGSSADYPNRIPALIVCPSSLVFNWVLEAKKFVPQLKVLAVHGSLRAPLFQEFNSQDVIVTSYALLRRDIDRYKEFHFDTLVLDEAQHIKNRQTQNSQVVKRVKSQNRIVLTGTPLENSVFDIWSIFDFLMPGYLGNADSFKERYEIPITRERDSQVQARLGKRLKPFLLRRLKRDVAKELPDKIEQVSFCNMTEAQSAIYAQILDAGRKEVLEAVGQHGAGKGRMAALNALLRLRQVCCDLRLLKLEQIDPNEVSGKLEMFEELLEEIIDGGHRALVFSQFVGMLSLIRERLETLGVNYCYLDGSTKDRQTIVSNFQENENIPLFLISLKAGGTGLNLTGADTVIHFDPWWNPAVEDQATDRAHRIGQSKVVTSYKLITRGSVEEKILHLQQRKRETIKALLEGEEGLVESLTWEEIQELLE